MTIDPLRALETEASRLLAGMAPLSRGFRWTSEGYAQGLLLHLLEQRGFTVIFLPTLHCTDSQGRPDVVAGCRLLGTGDGRTFTAYHPDVGVAVVMAAVMAVRAGPGQDRSRAAS